MIIKSSISDHPMAALKPLLSPPIPIGRETTLERNVATILGLDRDHFSQPEEDVPVASEMAVVPALVSAGGARARIVVSVVVMVAVAAAGAAFLVGRDGPGPTPSVPLRTPVVAAAPVTAGSGAAEAYRVPHGAQTAFVAIAPPLPGAAPMPVVAKPVVRREARGGRQLAALSRRATKATAVAPAQAERIVGDQPPATVPATPVEAPVKLAERPAAMPEAPAAMPARALAPAPVAPADEPKPAPVKPQGEALEAIRMLRRQ